VTLNWIDVNKIALYTSYDSQLDSIYRPYIGVVHIIGQ